MGLWALLVSVGLVNSHLGDNVKSLTASSRCLDARNSLHA